MLRVFGPHGHEDIDANGCQEQPGGGLLLTRVSVRYVRTNPLNLGEEPHAEISNPQLVALLAAGQWTRVENLDLAEDEETTAPALALTGGMNA